MLKSLFAGLAVILAACASPPSVSLSSESEVSLRLTRYAELLRRQDAPALSSMFEPAGSTAHQGQSPIVGRAAIQAFLESFASYKVLAYKMQVTSALAHGSTVTQAGTYAQTVLTPEGRTLQVAGTFTAIWRHEQSGPWLIESMRTAPLGGG